MLSDLVYFLGLLYGALVVGSMGGLWLGLNPSGLPASVFVAQHQQLVRGLNVALPALPAMGAVAIAFTLTAAYVACQQPSRRALLLLAAAGLIVADFVTRVFNQPLNAVVMTWTADSPPGKWEELRDRWWCWHTVRTGAGLVGLCSSIAATLRRSLQAKAGGPTRVPVNTQLKTRHES